MNHTFRRETVSRAGIETFDPDNNNEKRIAVDHLLSRPCISVFPRRAKDIQIPPVSLSLNQAHPHHQNHHDHKGTQ